MTAPDAEKRIRRIEDRLAIQDLAVRYFIAIDDSDYAGLLAMYTEKARLGEIAGRQEVVDELRAFRSTYGRTIHTPQGHTVRFVDDDHATGIVLSHAELDIAGQTIHTAIRYYDEYEREEGVWRFADRALKFAYAVPVSELGESLTSDLPVRWPGTEPAPADEN
jgi:hypothetical protein